MKKDFDILLVKMSLILFFQCWLLTCIIEQFLIFVRPSKLEWKINFIYD